VKLTASEGGSRSKSDACGASREWVWRTGVERVWRRMRWPRYVVGEFHSEICSSEVMGGEFAVIGDDVEISGFAGLEKEIVASARWNMWILNFRYIRCAASCLSSLVVSFDTYDVQRRAWLVLWLTLGSLMRSRSFLICIICNLWYSGSS
jgi:hypothetical protein